MFVGRTYTVPISGVASPAAPFDLWEFVPASNKPIAIMRIVIAQTGEPTTEEEQLALQIVSGHTTSGSGGGTPTPSRAAKTDTAAGFTAETMNTTIASGGTAETFGDMAWNTRAGVDIPFSGEEAFQSSAAERVVIRCPVAPADAVTIRGTVWVMELG
jgi:hypothetical protein